jgi:hypothetical protein
MGDAENLGHNIETHHPQEHTGGETQDEVEPITKFERKQATGQGRKERRYR